jgi:hypothetical protein
MTGTTLVCILPNVASRGRDVRSNVGMRDGARVTNEPGPDSPIQEWMVPALILAIYQHRRRIDELLSRLGPARRTAIEMAVAALLDGTMDVATLVARITEGCHDDSRRVQMLVEMLATRADSVDKRDQ